MRFHLVLLILLFTAGLVDGQKSDPEPPIFSLDGVIYGKETGAVRFKYVDEHNHVVLDTLMLNKGRFHFSGTVNRVCEAFLLTDLGLRNVDDSGNIRFLLEPGALYLYYHVHSRPVIKGSPSQGEKDRWDDQKRGLLTLEEKYYQIAGTLSKRFKDDPTPLLQTQIDGNQKTRDSISAMIRALDVNYIKTHRYSYLSAYLLYRRVRQLPLDSAMMLYDGLPVYVKKSTLGYYALSYLYPLTNDAAFRQANPLVDTAFTQRLSDLHSVRELVLKDTMGNTVSLNSFKARYYVIDFWASWCKPCIENIPALRQMSRDYAKDSVRFISVSMDTRLTDWKQALIKHHFNGIQLIDPDAFSGLSAVFCKVLWVPTYVVADRQGHIVRYNAPQAIGPDLRTLLDHLIEQDVSTKKTIAQ